MTSNTTQESSVLNRDDMVAAYVAADKSTKARLRATWRTNMEAALMAGDMETATVYLTATNMAKAATKPSTVTVDYAQLVADRIATLEAAIVAMRDIDLPDGADVDFDTLPDGTPNMADVAKLATIRTRSGKRNDIADFIASAVGESTEWVKVSAMSPAASNVSSGAVSARLNAWLDDPTTAPDGYEAGHDEKGRLAARYVG